jgi:Flp pilus assembly pilin Flp
MSIQVLRHSIATRMRSIVRDVRGAVAIEFALVLPVLIAVMFGIIQYGMVLFTEQMMVYAAREAARSYAVGTSTAAQAQTLAEGLLPGHVSSFSVTVDEPDPDLGETDVTVTISAPMEDAAIINVLGSLMSGNLQAAIVMRVEN